MRNFIPLSILVSQTLLYADASLGEIAITASPIGSHEAFDIPCQVDTVKTKDIESKATSSLGEVLSSIAGVNNLSTGSQAGKPVIRGFSGERVKILSNSNPTDFQTYGIRHIANVDPLLASRIEVVRGASGVLYGSDAMGGVVNVIDQPFLYAEDNATKFHGRVLSEYHTNNGEKALAAKTQGAIGKVGINLGASLREAENFQTGKSEKWTKGTTSNLPLFAGELPYTDFKNKSAKAGLGYTGDDFKIGLRHTFWESKQNFLGHTPAPDFNAVASAGQTLTNNETQLKASKTVGDWDLEGRVSHTHNQREAATNIPYQDMASAKGTSAYLDIDTSRDDIHIALKHPQVGIWLGEVGLQAYYKDQELKEGRLLPSAIEKGQAIYLFEEANLDRWILQGGIRYDITDINAALDGTSAYFVDKGFYDASNHKQNFDSIGGSLGATYKINESWALAGNFTKGFRSPTIFELFAGGVHGGIQAFQIGNPELQPEQSLGIDISLRYNKDVIYGNLTLYSNTINDYIYLANTGFKRNPTTGERAQNGLNEMRYTQTDARVDGVELSTEAPLSQSLTFRAKAEYIRGRDTKNHTALAYIPPSNVSFGITGQIGSWGMLENQELLIDAKFVKSKRVAGAFEPFAQYNNTPFGSADTAGYGLMDVGYKTQLAIDAKPVDFSVKISNIFDRAYRDYLDTYKGYALGMGRNISFAMAIPF
ncbi:MAG: TonB-dependent receptor [Campylobacterales bacterium]|nr:TonB-dependent receptor [Campylobacterales bacterium]